MEIKIIILIISAIINIFLGVLIYSKSKKEIPNILFSLMTFFIALWSMGLLFFIHTQSLSHAINWVKFYYIAASFIASVFLHFCLVFLIKKKLSLLPIILTYIFPIVLVFIFFFSNFLIKEITIVSGGKEVKLNLLYYSIYGGWYLTIMSSAFFILFKKYHQSTDIEKTQIKYVLSGTLISALLGMYFNLILPWIGNYKLVWIGPSTTLIMAVVMAYAITRHHILNIKVITTEILTALMAIMLLVRIPLSKTTGELVFNLIFFHIFLVLGILLIRTVWLEIHRVQEIEKLNKEKLAAYDRIKAQADELKQANIDLKKLLATKSKFMDLVSHQLRTPTSVVKGMLSMLVEGGLTPEEREKFIKSTYEASEKLSIIIRDIISATSIESGRLELQLEPTDLGPIINESVKEHLATVEQKRLKVNIDIPEGLPPVTADKYWLKQVFNNLLDNAIFYTRQGEINVKVKNNSENVTVSIKDTGVGINPEDKKRLFKVFTRGEKSQQVHPDGSGLGLYIAKNIINFHRGTIDITSEGQGMGTMVEVVMPKN